MSHTLVEIPYTDWPQLCELYNERKKFSSSYSLILNFINWKKAELDFVAKMYSLDGDWKNDGTFVLIDSELKPPKVFFNTLSSTSDRISLALDCLDKSEAYLFFAIQEHLLPAIKEHLIGFNLDDIRIDGTVWYYIEQEKALEFDININSAWPHKADGSVKFVERLIKSNDSVGAFDKDGKLIAWCLRLPVGSLGVLQVAETHRGQGIGSLIVRYLARLFALKNEEVFAPVIFKNSASRSMFEKLGFYGIDNVYWVLRPAKQT